MDSSAALARPRRSPRSRASTRRRSSAISSSTLPASKGRLEIRQFEGGQSNPTYFLHTAGRDYVLRKKPPGQLLPSAHAVDREHRVMKALAGSVPVPPMLRDVRRRGRASARRSSSWGVWTGACFDSRIFRACRRRIALRCTPTWPRCSRGCIDVDATAVGPGRLRQAGKLLRPADRPMEPAVRRGQDRRDSGDGSAHGVAAGEHSRRRRNGDRSRRLSRREPDLPSDRTANRGDRRLGVIDARPSARGSRLQLPDLPSAAGGAGPERDRRSGSQRHARRSAYVATYLRHTGRAGLPHWNFYLAFSMFRLASILQGVYARGLQGNAASAYALQRGAAARLIADQAWRDRAVLRLDRSALRLSSSLAIVSRCTSSGPSASRSVRACAHACARNVSWLTPIGAVRLDRAVDHLQRHVRRDHLDHRDRRPRRLVADGVHQLRGIQRQQPRLVDLDARLRDVAANRALLGQRLAERDALLDAPRTSPRARAPPGRSSACSDGCGRARAGPARSRSRGPRRAACCPPARAHSRTRSPHAHAAHRHTRTPSSSASIGDALACPSAPGSSTGAGAAAHPDC